MKKQIAYLITASLVFVACNSTEIGESKDIEPNAIAQQINVDYKENEGLSAKIRFRVSGLNGTTLVLNQPAKVALNNDALSVDSSKYYGAYYGKSLGSGIGTHQFAYTDKAGKTYKNSFTFNGFGLKNNIPSSISKSQDLSIAINGVSSTESVEYNVKDTSFGNDIAGKVNLINGNLIISKNNLSKLKNGPIFIDISCQKEQPIKEGTSEGGTIYYNFAIKTRKTILQ
jgi:hypothetical protein